MNDKKNDILFSALFELMLIDYGNFKTVFTYLLV